MAKPRPPLPDSDDPFVVLGLPPTARERDVRKAQEKLLKIYRPRKALAEFDRIQAATSRALWLVEVRDREQRSGVKSVASSVVIDKVVDASSDQLTASAEERAAWFAEVAATVASAPDAALKMVTDPRVLQDAARDVDWALAVLRVLGALAWRLPGIDEVRSRIKLAPGAAVADLSARVAMDLDAARAYHAWHRPILLPGLIEVVADGRVVDDRQHRANLALLGEQVRVDPLESFAHFDTMADRCPTLVAPLAQRLLEEVPPERRDLRDMHPDDVDALATKMRDVSRRTGVVQALATGSMAVLLSGVVAIVAGGGPTGGVGAFAIWGGYHLEKRQYERSVRAMVARVLVERGVTRACARQWLDGNRRRALRLARFSFHMKTDGALLLLGMAAAASRQAA